MTHICIGNLAIISSDNGLAPGRRQAIIWTNAGILLIGPLGTNFSEILIEFLTFSFKKVCLKLSWLIKGSGLCHIPIHKLPSITWSCGNIVCEVHGTGSLNRWPPAVPMLGMGQSKMLIAWIAFEALECLQASEYDFALQNKKHVNNTVGCSVECTCMLLHLVNSALHGLVEIDT